MHVPEFMFYMYTFFYIHACLLTRNHAVTHSLYKLQSTCPCWHTYVRACLPAYLSAYLPAYLPTCRLANFPPQCAEVEDPVDHRGYCIFFVAYIVFVVFAATPLKHAEGDADLTPHERSRGRANLIWRFAFTRVPSFWNTTGFYTHTHMHTYTWTHKHPKHPHSRFRMLRYEWIRSSIYIHSIYSEGTCPGSLLFYLFEAPVSGPGAHLGFPNTFMKGLLRHEVRIAMAWRQNCEEFPSKVKKRGRYSFLQSLEHFLNRFAAEPIGIATAC